MADLFGPQKITLAQQIDEVERELQQRAAVYPRQVSANKMSQTRADFHVARMRAVLRTLCWLKEHEAAIRAAAAGRADTG